MPSELSIRTLDATIRSFGGPNFNGSNISLAGLEFNYMGSNPGIDSGKIGNIAVSKVCMPNQKEGRVINPTASPFNPAMEFFVAGGQNINLLELYTQRLGAPTASLTTAEPVINEVRFNITGNVTSSSTSLPALDTGEWPANYKITIVNEATISGKGGLGGDASASSGGAAAASGGNGGPAIKARHHLTIINRGIIGGGGGGGGGSAGRSSGKNNSWGSSASSGGGGAGFGESGNVGGSPNAASKSNNGTVVSGGEGATAGAAIKVKGKNQHSSRYARGGRGGDLGQPGSSGGSDHGTDRSLAGGGSPGKAITATGYSLSFYGNPVQGGPDAMVLSQNIPNIINTEITDLSDVTINEINAVERMKWSSDQWDPTQSNPGNIDTWPWYYTGSTQPWRPARMSEFYASRDARYLGCNATAIPTGWDYPYGDIVLYGFGGRAPYFIYNTYGGGFWIGPLDGQYSFRAYKPYSSTLYIVDYDGCGGNFDAPTTNAHYP